MIDLFFALLNMAALFFLFYYLYGRFLQDRIQQDIILEQSIQLNSAKRQETLRKQEQSLVRAYYHQHYRYEELSHKIQQWRHTIDSVLQEKQQEAERLSHMMIVHRTERDDAIRQRVLCKSVINYVTDKAHRELVMRFQDATVADQYLERILELKPKEERYDA